MLSKRLHRAVPVLKFHMDNEQRFQFRIKYVMDEAKSCRHFSKPIFRNYLGDVLSPSEVDLRCLIRREILIRIEDEQSGKLMQSF